MVNKKKTYNINGYEPFDAMNTDLNSVSRNLLIEWLVWNDRNGVHSDKDRKNEGYKPYTKKEAIELVKDQRIGGMLKNNVGSMLKRDIENFIEYVDDNTIFDGEYYATQDAQYSNRLTKEKLIEYYFKEFKGMKLKKGSAEAKAYMAALRARKNDVGGIEKINKRAKTTYVHYSRTPLKRKKIAVKKVSRSKEKTTLMALRNLQFEDTYTLGKSGKTIYERGYKIPNKDAYEATTLAGKKVVHKGSVKVNLIGERGVSGYVHTKSRGTKSVVKYTRAKKLSGVSTKSKSHTDFNSPTVNIQVGMSNNNLDLIRKYHYSISTLNDRILQIQAEKRYFQPMAKKQAEKQIAFLKKNIASYKKQIAELKKNI